MIRVGRTQKRDLFLYPGEELRPSRHPKLRLYGATKNAIETGRLRLMVTAGLFCLAFASIGVQLVNLMLFTEPTAAPGRRTAASTQDRFARANIVDRNGVIVATNLPTVNLYADATKIGDSKSAADKLIGALPHLNYDDLLRRLSSKQRYVRLRPHLTPSEQDSVNRLGIPGVYFENAERRVYTQGSLFAHTVGTTDTDNRGNAGLEKTFDEVLAQRRAPLALSLDMGVQDAVHGTLSAGIARFRAEAGNALVMDVNTGEILAMVSLPDFDPNAVGASPAETRFNRNTLGTYEMGSTFKLFTAAMALDAGTAKLNSTYDASADLKIGKWAIPDFHGKRRVLSLPEVLIYSSNIGAARIALEAGTPVQKDYLRRFGLLSPVSLELPERGLPSYPASWRDLSTATIAYGHGISVTPVHVAAGVSALVNGGRLIPPTVIKREPNDVPPGTQVISPATSDAMRALMRMIVLQGSGSKADVTGYEVGGKTGSAEMIERKRYSKDATRTLFVATFPVDAPRYVVVVMLDRPLATKETAGYRTAGWNAAPIAGTIIAKIAPILGVFPMGHQDSFEPLMTLVANTPTDDRNDYARNRASVPAMMMDELAEPAIALAAMPVSTRGTDIIGTLIEANATELPEGFEEDAGAPE